jgi:hypothetical protein
MDILHFGPQEYLKIPCDPVYCNISSSAISTEIGKDSFAKITTSRHQMFGILKEFSALSFLNFFSNPILVFKESLFSVWEKCDLEILKWETRTKERI